MKLFKKGPTSKADVIMALAGALVGVYKALDTIRDYRADHQNEENEK